MFPAPMHALIDMPTSVVLTLSLRAPIIGFLTRNLSDTRPCWRVNYPNYRKEFTLGSAPFAEYPQWSWNWRKRLFEPTPQSLLTDRVKQASALAVEKSHVLFDITNTISNYRNLLSSDVLLQETVNLTKRMQAKQFLADGCPESDLQKYPYVLQVSEIEGTSYKEAAEEILFTASLDDELLARSEGLRLKYFKLIEKATLKDIKQVMHAFYCEIQF